MWAAEGMLGEAVVCCHVHSPPLREWLSRRLPALFLLINIQDNYVFVKKSFSWRMTSIIEPR